MQIFTEAARWGIGWKSDRPKIIGPVRRSGKEKRVPRRFAPHMGYIPLAHGGY
jgi:hypothetical protein